MRHELNVQEIGNKTWRDVVGELPTVDHFHIGISWQHPFEFADLGETEHTVIHVNIAWNEDGTVDEMVIDRDIWTNIADATVADSLRAYGTVQSISADEWHEQ
jgi:hypothetical protein